MNKELSCYFSSGQRKMNELRFAQSAAQIKR